MNSIEREQAVRLYIAGTVAVPAPYPEVGLISCASHHPELYSGEDGTDVATPQLICVRQVTPSRVEQWVVDQQEIQAIELDEAWCEENLGAKKTDERGKWRVGPEVQPFLNAFVDAGSGGPKEIRGTMYIRAETQVLHSVEIATSAGQATDELLAGQAKGAFPVDNAWRTLGGGCRPC